MIDKGSFLGYTFLFGKSVSILFVPPLCIRRSFGKEKSMFDRNSEAQDEFGTPCTILQVPGDTHNKNVLKPGVYFVRFHRQPDGSRGAWRTCIKEERLFPRQPQ